MAFVWMWLPIAMFAASVLAADSVSPEDRMQLADGLFRRGLYDLAAKEYAGLAETPLAQGGDVVLFRQAECLRRLKDLSGASSRYEELLKRFPASASADRARIQLALIRLEGGDKSAIEAALKSLDALNVAGKPEDVRVVAAYYAAQGVEKLGCASEAVLRYQKIADMPKAGEYGEHATLRRAWLHSQSQQPADRKTGYGLYLDLAYGSKNPEVAEEALYFAATMAFREGRYAESAGLFSRLAERFPKSSRIAASILERAWADYRAGRCVEAEAALTAFLNGNPGSSREEALYLKANCLRALDRGKEASTLYAQLVKEFPDGDYVGAARAEQLSVLVRAGDHAGAFALADTFPPDATNDADRVHWLLSEAALALGKRSEAIEHAHLAAEVRGSTLAPDAAYRVGWLQQQEKSFSAAAETFENLAEKFKGVPLASKALYSAGLCRQQLKDGAGALRNWTRLLELYPNCEEAAETLYAKAIAELRGGMERESAATLDERLRRFPSDSRAAECRYWRGILFRQRRQWKEAAESFEACLAAHPDADTEREARIGLGVSLFKLGDQDKAAALLQPLLTSGAVRELGGERVAWLAEFQAAAGRQAEALSAAKALAEHSDDPAWKQTGWTLAGRMHRARGERDAAIAAFRSALATGARTVYAAEASLRLGELLSEAGKYDEAEKQLEAAAVEANSAEQVGIRAHAYMSLALNAKARGDDETALRYFMSVGILFDDKTLVPSALEEAARIMEAIGRPAEAKKLRDERIERYPEGGAE